MAYQSEISRRRVLQERIIPIIVSEMEKKKPSKSRDPYDKDIWNRGMQWYQEGLSLEDAPSNIRENTNFIGGYELAERQDRINKTLELQGALWFFSEKDLDEASEKYKNNQHFIKGYNDAKNTKKHR